MSSLSGGRDVKLIGHWKKWSPVLLNTFRATSFWLKPFLSHTACHWGDKRRPSHRLFLKKPLVLYTCLHSYPRILSACHMRVEGELTCSSCARGGDRTIFGDYGGASYRRVINGPVINIAVRRWRRNFCVTGFKKQLKTVDKQKLAERTNSYAYLLYNKVWDEGLRDLFCFTPSCINS